MAEPTTAAGRALRDAIASLDAPPPDRMALRTFIPEVEQEARAQGAADERARLRADHHEGHPGYVPECPTCRLLRDPGREEPDDA